MSIGRGLRRTLGIAGMTVIVVGCGGSAATTAPSAAATAEASVPASQEATAAPSVAQKLRISYLVKAGTDPWFVTQTNAAKAKAAELGVDLTVQDLGSDANLAVSAVDTVIGQGTNGIIITVPDQKIGPTVIEKAKAANVPLLASDDEIKDSAGKAAPIIGIDGRALGAQVGDAIADAYTKAGWGTDGVAIAAVVDEELSVCNDRTDGAQEGFLKKVPGLASSIIKVPYDGSIDKAITSGAATLSAHPDIKKWLVWACNDAGVLGFVRATEQNNISADNVIGIGLDGSQACDEWKKGTPSGFKGSLWLSSALNGELAVQTMYDHLANGKPLDSVFFPGEIITPETDRTKIGCSN
jgi:L-arabinose transport system substrate-binding protein